MRGPPREWRYGNARKRKVFPRPSIPKPAKLARGAEAVLVGRVVADEDRQRAEERLFGHEGIDRA